MADFYAYKSRIADDILKRKLQGKGAVLIEGPKWCGKTTTALQIAQSALMLGKREELEKSKELIEYNPELQYEPQTTDFTASVCTVRLQHPDKNFAAES